MEQSLNNTPKFLLDPRSLANHVSKGTYDRGLAVYRNQQVLECELEGASATQWMVYGKVQGSDREAYTVSVSLEADSDGRIGYFNGDCSCPVESDCKHCVALTLKAAYKSGGVLKRSEDVQNTNLTPAPNRTPSVSAAPPTAQEQAEKKLTQWLDLFGHDAPAETPTLTSDVAQIEHLVFTLCAEKENDQIVLQLGYGLTRRLANGNWAKLKPLRYSAQLQGLAPQEREAMRLVDTLTIGRYTYGVQTTQAAVKGHTGLLALQLAAASGKLFHMPADRTLGKLLALGESRTVSWSWREASALSFEDPLWMLHASMSPASAQWYANNPPLYLDSEALVCGRVQSPGVSDEHLALLLNAPRIPQSALTAHESTLLRRLAGLPLPPVMRAPQVVRGVVPTACLRLEPVPALDVPRLGLLQATLRFDYGGLRHFAPHNRNPLLIEQPAADDASAVQRLLLHRDLDFEQAAQNALHELGLRSDASGRFVLPLLLPAMQLGAPSSQQQWLQWADDDFGPLRQAEFALELDDSLAHWITRAETLDVRLDAPGAQTNGDDLAGGLEASSPWFDLSLGIAINGQRRNILPLLPQLLAQLDVVQHSINAINLIAAPADCTRATLQLPSYVYLQEASGGFLRLPTEPLRPWLAALLDLVGERDLPKEGDTLRLTRLEALRVGAALGAGARWQGADSLRHLVQQLAGRSALPETPLPEGLQATLRPYQQQGLDWLQFLRANGLAGVLADDMGLGKTVQTLAHILVEKHAGRLDRPVLIVAPVSLMGNWLREAIRFTPDLRALALHGSARHEAAADMALYDVVIAPYSLLQRDRDRWLEQPWHLVVLDEAQNIKNAHSHAAQVAAELNTRHRLCLSGTPMENHLGELWSLFHFLMPGFLSSQARFKQLFRTPIEKHGDSERMDQLRRRVTPFMLRRAKRDVATDLPDKLESVSSVELGDKQADLYETIRLTTEKAVREALASRGLAKSQIQVLDALLKLRQVCCDPRLVPVPAARKVRQSAKLELLMELLPELLAEGRKVLLFSQFTSMLELIEEELTLRNITWVKLTGQSQKRDAIIERFTSGQVPLFLISLKAGGVGLNLTQADTVIHYDPWWNPAVENQATDRAHRIGQTQQVLVYKLVAQGTIEERILALQARKAALANSLYSDAVARQEPLFTENDLSELLKPLGA